MSYKLKKNCLDTADDVLVNLVKSLLGILRLGPAHHETSFGVTLGDEVHMDVRNDLVRNGTVVLENVVTIALETSDVELGRNGDLLGQRKQVVEVLVGDVVELLAMVLRNHQGVALGGGSNIEERIRLGSLCQFLAWDLTPDDFTENTAW